MSSPDVLPTPPPAQGPRREDKFLVTDENAARVAAWARANLEADPHAGPEGWYLVVSLYFDTPALDSFRRGGVDAWPKHRLRGYGPVPQVQFLEEKVRRGDSVWKRRVHFAASDWSDGLPGGCEPELLWFRGRWQRLGLRPVLHVAYRRLAFVTPSGERLTIDSAIEGRAASSPEDLKLAPAGGQRVFEHQVIELKYSGEPSPEMALAIRAVHDEPVRNSKYTVGVRALGLCPGTKGGE